MCVCMNASICVGVCAHQAEPHCARPSVETLSVYVNMDVDVGVKCNVRLRMHVRLSLRLHERVHMR